MIGFSCVHSRWEADNVATICSEQKKAAFGRKLPLISAVFSVPERPLSVKADVQILTLEISLPSDRYTPVSGHQADTMSRGR